MIDYDDYFGGMTPEKYEKETEERFKYVQHICASHLLDEYKINIFAPEFVSDEESEMLYYTILDWKEKYEIYNGWACEQKEK